ncbi:MAG: type II secretion system protein N [Pacificimonas sp.]
MRLRLQFGRAALFVAMLAIALVATIPLGGALSRLDAGRLGMSAADAGGSIWFGRLDDMRIGPAALGDVEMRLSLWRLFTGEARFDLFDGDGDEISGAIDFHAGGVGFHDISLSAPLNLSSYGASGQLVLADLSADLSRASCDRASGTASLSLAFPELATTLTGAPICEGETLLLRMTDGADIALDIVVSSLGLESATLTVAGADLGSTNILPGGAYDQQAGGYTLSL